MEPESARSGLCNDMILACVEILHHGILQASLSLYWSIGKLQKKIILAPKSLKGKFVFRK